MDKPDTPFPRHPYYYIALKIILLVIALGVASKIFESGDDGVLAAKTRPAAAAADGRRCCGGDLCRQHQRTDIG